MNLFNSLREGWVDSLFQVSVRVRDKADHNVMSIENLLKHFKDEAAAFHWYFACENCWRFSGPNILVLHICVHHLYLQPNNLSWFCVFEWSLYFITVTIKISWILIIPGAHSGRSLKSLQCFCQHSNLYVSVLSLHAT